LRDEVSHTLVIAGPPRSGVTRQSIFVRRKMDARVKPAHEA